MTIEIGLEKGLNGSYRVGYVMGHDRLGLSSTLNDALNTDGRYVEFRSARRAIIDELEKYGIKIDEVKVTSMSETAPPW